MVLVSSFHSRKMQYQASFQHGRVLFLSALFLKVLSRHGLSSIQLFPLYCSGSKKLVDMKSYVKSFLSKRNDIIFQHLYDQRYSIFISAFSSSGMSMVTMISTFEALERLYVNGNHDLFIVTERNFQIGTGKYKCLTCYELLDSRKMIAVEPSAKLVQQE